VLTRRAKYGLKAVLALARNEGEAPMHIVDIAAGEGIPRKFLELILLDLKKHHLLRSKKGRGGGYTLARPAYAITVGEVIRALDGPLAPTSCVSVNFYRPCDECADEELCGVRLVMKDVRQAVASVVDRITLADALDRVDAAAAMLGRAPPGG
jgi:Rrf2 family protein